MKLLFLFTVYALFCLPAAFSQSGGKGTYNFLQLPSSAQAAAMGGMVISSRDGDLNFVRDNPAVLDSTMHNHLSLNYINYFSDINFGYVSYARQVKNIGTFAAGIQYINYGTFTEANLTGEKTGEFTAGEYSLDLSYSRPIDSLFYVGGSLKNIYSALEEFQSYGLAADFGGHYLSANRRFSAGLVMRNMGSQLVTYTGTGEPLPFELQAAISKRVAHAPFRLTLLLRNLQTWDLTYKDPDQISPGSSSFNEDNEDPLFTADKLMRHVVASVEFIPTENFFLVMGFSYHRRQEMKLTSRAGAAGYSFGAGIKIKRFRFSYGNAAYHLAGSSHHITVTTNLGDFYSKK